MWFSTARIIRIVIITISFLSYLTDYGDCQLGTPDKDNNERCSRFELSPTQCRENNCTYTCADRNCVEYVKGHVCEPQRTIPGIVVKNDGRNICPSNCHNVCECRKTAACQFDITGGNCRPAQFYAGMEDNVKIRKNFFVKDDCQHHGAYYVEGGLICRNSRSDGDCESIKQILAVNLNGDELYDPTPGIKYSADAVIPNSDPFDSRAPARADGEITGTTTEKLKELYATYITGLKDVAQKGRCISYEIPLVEEGQYELIIKLGEFLYAEPNKRGFGIKFNRMDIILELDLFQTIGADNHAGDIILKFEIMKKNILWAKGFMPSVIQNGKTELSFCYGSCKDVDTSYLVSAFAVVKFLQGEPPKPPPPDKCNDHSSSKCSCKLNGCEFNSAVQKCVARETYCEQTWLKDRVCRKAGTFLVHGGVICPTKKNSGNCRMTKLVHAVNINGVEHTDLEGIKYVADAPNLYEDPFGTRWDRFEKLPKPSDRCYVNGPEWTDISTLYYRLMEGQRIDSKRNPDHCTSYFITLVGDGRYLLTINTIDFHDLANSHISTIKFNDVEILPDVDVTRQIGRCKRTDFLINFRVEGAKLLIDGFSPVDLPAPGPVGNAEPLRLSFCYGSCTDPRIDTRYLVSAFSVALLEHVNTTGKGGCELAPNSKDIPTCKNEYFDAGECRKSGKFYIGKNGLPCRNIKSSGAAKCKIIEHVRAVNINGDLVSDDEARILYRMDEPTLFKDPSNTRVEGVANGIIDSPVALEDLYKQFVSGRKDPNPGDKCLTYEIPMHIDGNYELILKLGEFEYNQPGKRRFKVKLNNMEFMPELDVHKLIGTKGRVADLVLQFSLSNETMLRLKGSDDMSKVEDGKIDLSFCYGSCNVPDKSYMMSGFAVVRYTYTGPPGGGLVGGGKTVGGDNPQWPISGPNSKPDPEELCNIINGNTTVKKGCVCHRADCEYAWDEGLCIHKNKKCPEILERVKCQKDGFFAQDAVICKMTHDDRCNIVADQVIKAINVGGEDYTGKDGIKFNKETEADFIYEYATQRRLESYEHTFEACKAQGNTQVKKGDSQLYYTFAHGWSRTEFRKPENCLHYPINIVEDGMYELGLKFIETYHTKDHSYFTGKLNNQTILSRFDMIVYRENKCVGMDVYVHFRVSNGAKTLRIHGKSQSSRIEGNEIRLSFCYGDLATDCIGEGGDPNYSISAFYVAKFDPKDYP